MRASLTAGRNAEFCNATFRKLHNRAARCTQVDVTTIPTFS